MAPLKGRVAGAQSPCGSLGELRSPMSSCFPDHWACRGGLQGHHPPREASPVPAQPTQPLSPAEPLTPPQPHSWLLCGVALEPEATGSTSVCPQALSWAKAQKERPGADHWVAGAACDRGPLPLGSGTVGQAPAQSPTACTQGRKDGPRQPQPAEGLGPVKDQGRGGGKDSSRRCWVGGRWGCKYRGRSAVDVWRWLSRVPLQWHHHRQALPLSS